LRQLPQAAHERKRETRENARAKDPEVIFLPCQTF
jgi:hypothetical protein